jgi:hypothetical protein
LLVAGLWAAEPAAAPASPKAEPPGSIGPDGKTKLAYLHVDVASKTIDLDGDICLTEGPLELLATVAAAKEHEAVVRVKSRPRDIHLALLMIGLKPGSPGRWTYEDKKPKPFDATGDKVAITLVYELEGKTIHKPVNLLFKDPRTQKTAESNVFLFAGSKIQRPPEGEAFYAADGTGDVATLVSFEEELLAWPKAASNANEDLQWVANTAEIPKLGTAVKLRLQPAREPGK